MSKQVDCYFTSLSPFTYLGHDTFVQLAAKSGTAIRFKPVILKEVFAVSGVLPIPERPQCRQNYRLLEIERWAAKRELPINLKPAFFPADPTLADKCAIALQEEGLNTAAFVGGVLAACWAEEKNIADESVITAILDSLGFNSQSIISQAQSPDIQEIYQANTREAIERGTLGAPAYFYNNEQFWGQDRLVLLSDRLNA